MAKPAPALAACLASLALHLGLAAALYAAHAPTASPVPPAAAPSPLLWVERVVVDAPAALAAAPPPRTPTPRPRRATRTTPPSPTQAAPSPAFGRMHAEEVHKPDVYGEAEGEAEAEAENALPHGGGGDAAAGVASTAAGTAAAAADNTAAGNTAAAANTTAGNTALQQRLQEYAWACYPRHLGRYRFEGVSVLAFCVDKEGMARQTRLAQSSGYASLDRAAVECVLKKAQPLPAASHGRCFTAPIAFGR